MSVIQVLMDEHRVIEQVLSCLEKMASECERENRLDARAARDALAFFRNFADRCHHGKEEDLLFPALESRGFSAEQGPTAVMRMEHVQGREFIGAMDRAIEGAAQGNAEQIQTFVHNARGYVLMLRDHIQKEDQCLFPMAEQALDTAAREELSRGFHRVEHEDIGEHVHREFIEVADRLAERYGVERAEVKTEGCGCGHDHTPQATRT